MKKNEEIRIKKIIKSDYVFLYELLMERRNNEKISHKSMPDLEQHIKFVKSKPYINWYIIYYDKSRCGSIYLSKQDEIGICLKKAFSLEKVKKAAIKLMIEKNPRDRYLFNINPKNTKMKKFLQKNKSKLIQHTYELIFSKKERE